MAAATAQLFNHKQHAVSVCLSRLLVEEEARSLLQIAVAAVEVCATCSILVFVS